MAVINLAPLDVACWGSCLIFGTFTSDPDYRDAGYVGNVTALFNEAVWSCA